MVLSDRTIKEEIEAGSIVIDPLDPINIQPASVDVRLDRSVLVFRNSRLPYIDVRQDVSDLTEPEEISEDQPFILHPGEFVLASTLEHIEIPADIVARLEGKSSLGRIGLLIHSTAGYVDPGWKGHLTLELSNVSERRNRKFKNSQPDINDEEDLAELMSLSDDETIEWSEE